MHFEMRNFRLGVYNGVLYIFSETLLDPTLVLIAFLSQMTNSAMLLGLVVPLRDGAWALPQLWVSCFMQRFPQKIVMYRRMSFLRIGSWFILMLVINFLHDPTLVLVAFFLSYSVGALASGLSGLPFLEVVGKTIPAERRGEFFAWRFGLGGLVSIGGSLLVRYLIDPNGPIAFPHNFGLLSALYFIGASASLLLYNLVNEPSDPIIDTRPAFSTQLLRGYEFFRKDVNYRHFIIMQSMLMISGSATPFFAVYVQQSLGGSKAMVGLYLAILMITNLLSNLLFGRVSRLFGNRKVMIIGTGAGISMSILVFLLAALAMPLHISAEAASNWLIPVFVLSGLRGTGIGVAGNSLLLDISPIPERSLYIGFSNTFQGLVLLMTTASGVIMALIGFKTLVFLTLVAHIAAFVSAIRMKHQKFEPYNLFVTEQV